MANTNKTGWYCFWKKVHGHLTSQTYVYFDLTDDSIMYENIQDWCEEWADNQSGGEYSGYRYGYKKINKPPVSFCKEEIKYSQEEIERLQKWISILNKVIEN